MKPISGKRMCQLLRKRGWILARTRGSHHAFQNPVTGQLVIVPVHGNKDLKPGTQRHIMHDAGLTDVDL